MAIVPPPVPETKVLWASITLEDTHPTTGIKTSFTFSKKMTANPLTHNGGLLKGSGPNGKATWWPFFQARHTPTNGGRLWWVQGHLLNDKVHGPGEPHNLLPISGVLNTNMEALAENCVKQLVINEKRMLIYVVEAHWEGAKNRKDGNTGAAFHPEEMRKTYGLKGVDKGGSLLWGEQFAPTRLSWSIWELNRDMVTGALLSTPLINTYKGAGNHYDDTQWMNHFPEI